MSDVAEIAKGLTEAQRRAVLWCNADGSPREWLKGAETSFYCLADVVKGNPTKEIATCYKLATRGEGVTKRGYWPVSTWALTPLGIAIRAHLQSDASQAEGTPMERAAT